MTNALGKQTQYTYDAANELTKVTQPETNISTYTSYDAKGNVISQQDGVDVSNNTSVSYGYDAQDRVTSMTDRARPQATYAYDGAGRLTSMTNPLGQTTTFGYDAADELTCVSTGSCTSPTISYAYTLDGQRQSITDSTGTTTYTYDSLGRLTQSTTSAGTEKYGYDLAGNLTQLTYPGTNYLQVTRAYDAANRLASISDGMSPAHVTSFSYNANDLLTHISYPNSTTITLATQRRVGAGAPPDLLASVRSGLARSSTWSRSVYHRSAPLGGPRSGGIPSLSEVLGHPGDNAAPLTATVNRFDVHLDCPSAPLGRVPPLGTCCAV